MKKAYVSAATTKKQGLTGMVPKKVLDKWLDRMDVKLARLEALVQELDSRTRPFAEQE